jgi:MFS family permease
LNIAPVASALCNKWGCRPIGIIGSIIASAAVAASVYSPNIYIMWLLFGFVGGIGMGLVYLPSIIMVGYYFEEKRAIATGKVCFFIRISSRVVFFRYCYSGHGNWFDYIWTTFTFFI